MPSVNKGIIPPDTAALLAASGPATPSIAPFPKRSGSFATRRSSVYDTNEAVTGPPPGTSPRKNPKKLPRIMGFHEALQSAKVGQRPLIFSASTWFFIIVSQFIRISDTPYKPITTDKISMPADRLTVPKVKRSCPFTISMPTIAAKNPSAIISTPLIVEPPII